MIVVTGAAGFIGSNIIRSLNAMGRTDILAVDDLSDGHKFENLASASILDYQDQADFLAQIIEDRPFSDAIEVIFHEGACSATTEWDGRYMMRNNYEYSKTILYYCIMHKIPFLYASSAAVYGAKQTFLESEQQQVALNVYGYSKWLFDQHVLKMMPKIKSQVVGFRYFNVYGPQEQHKGSMASVAFHLMNQLRDSGVVKLFAGSGDYGNGEQLRDFVFVDDVVKVNLWFWQQKGKSGIYNVGTGQAREFNVIANTLLKHHGSGELQYIPFPDHLKGVYQDFTQADITKLREAGYTDEFTTLENGIREYYERYYLSR